MPDSRDFLLESYFYTLPEELIAQKPSPVRGADRLMLVRRKGPLRPELRDFSELPDLLPEGALLVANNSRVLPARLEGLRSTGGRVEFLLLSPLPAVLAGTQAAEEAGWRKAPAEGLLRSGGHPKPGEEMAFGPDLRLRLLERGEFGRWRTELLFRGDLAGIFERAGRVPLPPYIRRAPEESDRERYQTVYARPEKTGSVAAPTAGLHMTRAVRERLLARGTGWAELTLYVGYGTFSPVRCQDIREHSMHAELVELPEETARAVLRAKEEGRPVIALGTTSARALEGAYRARGSVAAWTGLTDIFLYPGQPFRVTDGLLTNFHLPGSSLVMLVAALMGRERTLEAYRQAVAAGFRFFSYGDAMLILP